MYPSLLKLCFATSIGHVVLPSSVYAFPATSQTTSSTSKHHVTFEKRGQCCSAPETVENLEPTTMDRIASRLGIPTAFDDSDSESSSSLNSGDSLGLSLPQGDADIGAILRRPNTYRDNNGDQFSLLTIQQRGGAAGLMTIWREAIVKGEAFRAIVNKYVGSKVRRVDDASAGPKPKRLRDSYRLSCRYITDYDKSKNDFMPIYTDAGVAFQSAARADDYWDCDIWSRGQEQVAGPSSAPAPKPVLRVAINSEIGIIVVLESNKADDLSAPVGKLYTSELLWQTWEDCTTKDAERQKVDPKQLSRNLKYIMQAGLTNQETDNIVRVVHIDSGRETNSDGTKCVDRIPQMAPDYKPTSGLPARLSEDMGQGRWLQDNRKFNTFIALPGIRSTGQLLADHNTDLENPYYSVIHTFPRRDSRPDNGIMQEDARAFYVIIELGPTPTAADLSCSCGDTIQTS